ncbi:hypothetical protein [Methylobacterium sp. W2]|uniref:hypothetical protein n=1 Tax=Methylobacterium sp. W2 TaxID=2598107 RepID=UPI001D0C0DF4|nr:hypothetical protein [Methylobacterium sp. W2]
MSDTATPIAEPEVERVRDVVRLFNLNAGSGPGLLADAMKPDTTPADPATAPDASGED